MPSGSARILFSANIFKRVSIFDAILECAGGVYLFKHIKPAPRALGIPWVTWQVLRRSHATWLKMAGADVKDAQAQMRHSRASTTLDIYQQLVPESQRRAVDLLSQLPTSGVIQ